MQSYIQCGQCGHRHPSDRVRRRGYITCTCGIRIEAEKQKKTRRVINLAVIGGAVAAALSGAAYLWARGVG